MTKFIHNDVATKALGIPRKSSTQHDSYVKNLCRNVNNKESIPKSQSPKDFHVYKLIPNIPVKHGETSSEKRLR